MFGLSNIIISNWRYCLHILGQIFLLRFRNFYILFLFFNVILRFKRTQHLIARIVWTNRTIRIKYSGSSLACIMCWQSMLATNITDIIHIFSSYSRSRWSLLSYFNHFLTFINGFYFIFQMFDSFNILLLFIVKIFKFPFMINLNLLNSLNHFIF